jgi:hypothetical protein
MPIRLAIFALSCIALLPATIGMPAWADTTTAPPAHDLLGGLKPLPNDLARHQHLTGLIPRLPEAEQSTGQQLLAALDDQLGLYNRALLEFPFDNRIVPPPKIPLPAADAWQTESAVAAITAQARRHRIVMVNEAHHDAHTRVLTLELLPKLYALGFRYLAVEALGHHDPELPRRGYATPASGSEYLHEPLYGEIVRQAIRLGYTLVPYDSDAPTPAGREAEQAGNIYRQVFAKDPQARLLVHAGYAHIDKAPGNLGGEVQPMAMRLAQLTGIEPLSIDQTQFRDIDPGRSDPGAYGVLVERFHPARPVVLRNGQTGKLWSADPARHDISVVLPPAGSASRPRWLTLDGERRPRQVDAGLCHDRLPCIVEAHYADEPDDATAADRYTFLHDDEPGTLYLYPGRYRLRGVDVGGHTLGRRSLDVRRR